MRCLLYRWVMIRDLDAARAPSDRLLRHLDRCERCRRRYEQQVELAARLRKAAPVAPPLVPPLQHRILTTVGARRPGTHLLRRLAPGIAGLAAAAIVILVALLAVRANRSQRPNPITPRPVVNRDAVTPTPEVPMLAVVGEALDQTQLMAAESLRRQARHIADRAKTTGWALLRILPQDIGGRSTDGNEPDSRPAPASAPAGRS